MGATNFPNPGQLIKCDDCRYKAKSMQELIKHKDDEHVRKKDVRKNEISNRTCRYWLRGNCNFGINCNFKHSKHSRNNCKYYPNCHFEYRTTSESCAFQQNCVNTSHSLF